MAGICVILIAERTLSLAPRSRGFGVHQAEPHILAQQILCRFDAARIAVGDGDHQLLARHREHLADQVVFLGVSDSKLIRREKQITLAAHSQHAQK